MITINIIFLVPTKELMTKRYRNIKLIIKPFLKFVEKFQICIFIYKLYNLNTFLVILLST